MTRHHQFICDTVERLRSYSSRPNLGSPSVMVANLVFLYHVISASENLMKQALEETDNGVLADYLTVHQEEERDHAKWLADDLATAGIDVSKLHPSREAAEFAGLQYYDIFHVSPLTLLGYMLVLEGFPFPMDLLEQLEAIHGKPLLRCLRFHAEHDLEHRKELFRTIDRIDDPEGHILNAALRTQRLLNEVSHKLCSC